MVSYGGAAPHNRRKRRLGEKSSGNQNRQDQDQTIVQERAHTSAATEAGGSQARHRCQLTDLCVAPGETQETA
jgi:hypothetical protein